MANYKMLAARAVAHCPRDLAEALSAELGMPMPESYFDTKEAYRALGRLDGIEEVARRLEANEEPESVGLVTSSQGEALVQWVRSLRSAAPKDKP